MFFVTLMPELASRKQVNSNWIYDANAIGSISCVKQMVAAPAKESRRARFCRRA